MAEVPKRGGEGMTCTNCQTFEAIEHGRESTGTHSVEWHLCRGCFSDAIARFPGFPYRIIPDEEVEVLEADEAAR